MSAPTPSAPYIFVSYASADRERVLPIVAALEGAGVPVWLDREGIAGGANYALAIAEAIQGCAALVLMVSAASLGSRNVRQELALAWRGARPYVPLLLEPAAIPNEVAYWLEAAQWVEVLDHPTASWLPRVLAALGAHGIAPAPSQAAVALAGREREQAALREHLDAMLAGRGGLVLVGGEAGVGKTTLAEALCREAAERGALALVGRCYDLAETPPYGPWLEITAQYPGGPGLPPLPAVVTDRAALAAIAGQAALFDQVLAWFAAVAAARPLVLLLDDLHWADPASLDLLRLLARGVATRPLLLLATYRADELTRRHPLYQLLPSLVREAQATRLDLRPLDDNALRALIAARYPLPDADVGRLVAHLRARAEGNPFYAGELLRTLAEEGILARAGDGWRLGDLAGARVPPLLRQVIDARLDRLGEEARGLLAVAAAIGPAVPLDLWATVAQVGEDALVEPVERAAEAGLLIESSDGATVRFAHALIREALYEGTAAIRRRAWHRRVGEALAAAAGPDPDAVAYHFRQAGDARAGEWLVRAGERAQRTYAWVTAAERFEAALPLLSDDAATAGKRGWLMLRIGLLRRYTDRGQALAYLEAAGEAAQLAGDPDLAARARFAWGLVRCYVWETVPGIAAMAEGIVALESLPPADPATRVALRAQGLADDLDAFRGTHVLWLAIVGDYARALPLAEAVVMRLPATIPTGVLDCAFAPDALRALGVAYTALGRPDEARRMHRRTLEAYRASGDLHQVGGSALNELVDVVLPYQTDNLAARRALAAEAREMLMRAGQSGSST